MVHTLMLLSRLSRELKSSPSLQACRQEMTFWLSMVPGRMVSPDRLPRKYWVKRGFVTSPPAVESKADISRRDMQNFSDEQHVKK